MAILFFLVVLGSRHKHQITPLHLNVAAENKISHYTIAAVNVSLWSHSLPFIFRSHVAPLHTVKQFGHA